ncbi:MAG: homoserine dehydrogenase [Caldilineaceae bacterium]|nr:homoserine dehydrogenase [Caldilineaceae bacterium]
MQIIDTYLVGLGNVNRSFLRILEIKGERLRRDYGLALRVVALADSSGVAVNPAGFDPASTRQAKEAGVPVAGLPGYQPGLSPAALMEMVDCDLVLEASPVNLQTGEPGLGVARAALRRGVSVVLANKAPLALAFGELHRLAQETGAGLGYSATVCGALPVINLGRRDLVAADILSLRGIFNSTSNFILGEMAAGRAYGDALAEAQQRGIAETDPTLDVEGWDTANKLVIIANSFLGVEIGLADVAVEGITRLTPAQIAKAAAQGQTIKLVAQAQQQADGSYHLSVGPLALAADDFLASCAGWEMGVEIHSDLYGRMYHKIWEREPLPTAAAMLRDAVNLFQRSPNWLR